MTAVPDAGRHVRGHGPTRDGVDDPPLAPRRPALGLHRRAVLWWMLRSFLRWGAVLAVLLTVTVLWSASRPWLVAPICAAAVVLLATVLVEPFWRFRVHRWETTEKATYAVTGWLVVEWRASPISRIQTADVVRGPLEQLLGLATLRVTTASSYGSVDVVGLDEATAHAAVARLSTLAELTEGDAT